jgi:beta-lactamase regulating signal transducer with metallopeptidase domain
MDTFVSWLIRSALISGLMLAYYHGVLRNRKLHAFNRVWLLTALLASLVLPLIPVNFLTWHSAAPPQVITTLEAHPAGAKAFPVMTIVLIAGAVVSALLLSILVIRIWRVYRLKRHHHVQRLEGCMLIEIQDRRAPFSFLKNLFWQEGADIHDPFHRKILDHELAHIRGGHTLDILFAQTLSAVFWMNPFYWLIRRELFMVHEFIADDASIAAGDTETFARMLLQAYDDGRYLDPSHHFFHSPIKRRLRMISSSKSPSGLRKWLALPVLLAVMVLSCSKEQGATSVNENKTPPPPPPIKVVGATFKRDSVKVRFSNAGESVKEIHYISEVSSRDSIHVSGEPAVAKQAPAEIVIIGYITPSDRKAVEKGQN